MASASDPLDRLAAICARARIARGTLYQYFKDKRDVLAALIDRIVGRITDAARQWPPFELPPGGAWTEEDNIAFIEARCSQIMQVVFAGADTARPDPPHGPRHRLRARGAGPDR